MLDWLLIQAMPHPDNVGWIVRWRWDDKWVRGSTKRRAIAELKENSW